MAEQMVPVKPEQPEKKEAERLMEQAQNIWDIISQEVRDKKIPSKVKFNSKDLPDELMSRGGSKSCPYSESRTVEMSFKKISGAVAYDRFSGSDPDDGGLFGSERPKKWQKLFGPFEAGEEGHRSKTEEELEELSFDSTTMPDSMGKNFDTRGLEFYVHNGKVIFVVWMEYNDFQRQGKRFCITKETDMDIKRGLGTDEAKKTLEALLPALEGKFRDGIRVKWEAIKTEKHEAEI